MPREQPFVLHRSKLHAPARPGRTLKAEAVPNLLRSTPSHPCLSPRVSCPRGRKPLRHGGLPHKIPRLHRCAPLESQIRSCQKHPSRKRAFQWLGASLGWNSLRIRLVPHSRPGLIPPRLRWLRSGADKLDHVRLVVAERANSCCGASVCLKLLRQGARKMPTQEPLVLRRSGS